MPPTNAAHFGNEPTLISISAGTFTPPNGAPIGYSATSIPHFLDAPLAAAHFAEANRLASDDAALRALDGQSPVVQAQFFFGILSHIANGYNALGIVWSSDPTARQVYRRWIAGPPQGNDQIAISAQFSGDTYNYREDWYGFAFPWPQLDPSSQDLVNTPPTGLPLAALTQFRRFGGTNAANVMQWVQLCGLYVDVLDRTTSNPRDIEGGVAYAPSVRNRAFAMIPTHTGDPTLWTDGAEQDPFLQPGDEHVVQERFRRAVMFGGVAYDALPMPPTGVFINQDTGARVENADMRSFAYDESLIGSRVPLKVANALVEYAGWLREWAAACVGRAPSEIVAAARMYILWMNDKTQGSNVSVATEIVNRDAQLQADRARPDPVATTVFTAMAAIAPALSVAGPYGAAVGLGVAAIAAVGRIVTAAVGSGVSSQRKRDDLGIFKPQYQRAMLAGSLLTDTPPDLQIPPPAGWTRPLVLSAILLPGMAPPPPPLDGKSILDALHADAKTWRTMPAAQRATRLASIGFVDPAAQAAAAQAIEWFLDPSARPLADTAGGSGGGSTALLLGGAALAGLLLWMRGRR